MQILRKILPFISWFKHYPASYFRIDLISGITVALVLIPQSMAYAQLAGLPAYFGLYASFLPPVIAALFGSSRQLATGPVAVVSLMTATALEPLATAGSESFVAYAVILALMVGLFQLVLGIFKLGIIVNLLSHPVVNGFTNAAAIIIASSQLSKIFGVMVDKGEYHYETILRVIKAALDYTHLPTLGMAILAFTIMIFLRRLNPKIPNVLVAVVVTTLLSYFLSFEKNYTIDISSLNSQKAKNVISKFNSIVEQLDENAQKRIALRGEMENAKKQHGIHSIPVIRLREKQSIYNLHRKELGQELTFYREILRSFKFDAFTLNSSSDLQLYLQGEISTGMKQYPGVFRLRVSNRPLQEKMTFFSGGLVVGNIPKGIPALSKPKLDFGIMLTLFPMAIIISLLGFMEAISIAKAMAAKTEQKLDPNQELIGQGLANIIGSIGQSYPVSGSFSRSAVNLQAGAVTGMSNVFSSCIVAITLLFFTPLLYHLPQAVLAAIIMMAVIGLINVKGFIHAWHAKKYDGIILLITFISTLAFAPHLDKGIIIGVLLSIGVLIFTGMRPKLALLSKHMDGTHRDNTRFSLEQCRHIALVRFHGSLFFSNISYLEEEVLDLIAKMPHLKHIILYCNGINEIDASGEEMLSLLVSRLRFAEKDISFCALNDSVLDTFRRTGLDKKIGKSNIYLNISMALDYIHEHSHENSKEKKCPLLDVCSN